MTSDSITAPGASAVSPLTDAAARPKGFLRTAIGTALRRTSARVGLVWIATVVLAGVFGPLVASSSPIVMADDKGRLSSPMLHSLDYSDITLLTLAASIVLMVLLRRHMRPMIVVAVLAIIVGGVLPITYHLFPEQEAVSYSRYREDLRDGFIKSTW